MKELKSKGKQSGSAVRAVHLSTDQFSKASKGQKGWMSWEGEAEMAQRTKPPTTVTRTPIHAMYSQKKKNKTKPKHRMRQTKQGIRMHSETAKCRVNIRDSGSPLLRLCDRAATLLPLPSYRHKPCLRWEVSNAKCVGWS